MNISAQEEESNELLDFLLTFITEQRREKFETLIANRTRHLTVVLENVFQSHNISAVLRSCECFGVQDVHIIENVNPFKTHADIVLGADKWLTLHHYRSEDAIDQCFSTLKKNGYLIVATSPHYESYNLENLPVDQKFALVFGTEMDGITERVIEQADMFVKIPMAGFTESLNISVSAAVSLYALTQRTRTGTTDWRLNCDEKTAIMLSWVRNTLKRPEILEREFAKNKEL
ncbi:MAG: RNA methyltransferase [Bacteroidetes bacterium]|nr:RNA methyltransferase [Bacteroidota bacterium]